MWIMCDHKGFNFSNATSLGCCLRPTYVDYIVSLCVTSRVIWARECSSLLPQLEVGSTVGFM
jgi:hypothetical protein